MMNVTTYTNFLINTGLTQPQLLLLILIKNNKKDLIEKYKERFPTEDGTMIGQKWTDDLFEKKWLIKQNNKIVVSSKFNKLYTDRLYHYRELVENYPKFFIKDNVNYPLVLGNEHELSYLYNAKIYNDIDLHNEILELINYGKKNNLINFSIQKFIESKFWIALKEHRDKEINTENIDFNNF